MILYTRPHIVLRRPRIDTPRSASQLNARIESSPIYVCPCVSFMHLVARNSLRFVNGELDAMRRKALRQYYEPTLAQKPV